MLQCTSSPSHSLRPGRPLIHFTLSQPHSYTCFSSSTHNLLLNFVPSNKNVMLLEADKRCDGKNFLVFFTTFTRPCLLTTTCWMQSALRATARCQLKLAIWSTLTSDSRSDENISVTDYIRLLFCKNLPFERQSQPPIHRRLRRVRSTLLTFHRCLL